MKVDICSIYSVSKVRMDLKMDPLGPYVDEVFQLMRVDGYSLKSIKIHFAVIRILNCWLVRNNRKLDRLSRQEFDDFRSERRRKLSNSPCSDTVTLDYLFKVLRGHGVIPFFVVKEQPKSEVAKLVDRFAQYLEEERGLFHDSVNNYKVVAHRFLSE